MLQSVPPACQPQCTEHHESVIRPPPPYRPHNPYFTNKVNYLSLGMYTRACDLFGAADLIGLVQVKLVQRMQRPHQEGEINYCVCRVIRTSHARDWQ